LGSKDHVDSAIVALSTGLEKLSYESPRATWFQKSVEEANAHLETLKQHPTYQEEATALQQEYEDFLRIDRPDEERRFDEGFERLLESMEDQYLEDPYPTAPSLELTQIPMDQPLILEGGGWNWFEFAPRESGRFVISANSENGEVDPIIVVRNADGRLLGNDDDGGGYPNSQLVIDLSEERSYRIGVGPAVGSTVEGAELRITQDE
jgi:hypothetical protein